MPHPSQTNAYWAELGPALLPRDCSWQFGASQEILKEEIWMKGPVCHPKQRDESRVKEIMWLLFEHKNERHIHISYVTPKY